MQPFRFAEAQQLDRLEQSLAGAFRLYNERSVDLPDTLLRVLDDAVSVYRARGRGESRMLSLKAELVTALRGIHPVTLEKVAVRRGEMQTTIAFKVLQSMASQLRDDRQPIDEALQRAEELLAQIVAAAVQKGLLTDAVIAQATTPAAADALWSLLAADAEVGVALKRVLLMVSRHDAVLLFDGLLAGLRE